MAFTRPVAGQDISAENFGQPTYDMLRQGAGTVAIKRDLSGTAAASATTVISDITYTFGAEVKGLMVVASLAYTAPGAAADLQIVFGGTTVGVIAMANGLCVGTAGGVVSGTSQQVIIRINAWGAQQVVLTAAKCSYMLLPLSSYALNQSAFPV